MSNILQLFSQMPLEISFLLLGIVYFMLFLLVRVSFKALKRTSEALTYSEEGSKASQDASAKLLELEQKIQAIDARYKEDILEKNDEFVRSFMADFLEEKFPALVQEKIESLKNSDNPISNLLELDQRVEAEIKGYLAQLNPDSMASQIVTYSVIERRNLEVNALNKISEEQLRNSGRMKTVMINLFVYFNLGVLLVYVSGNLVGWTQTTVFGIVGLYISLAAFIIYIYRASNARTSVVMAIQEDSVKYFGALEYLTRVKKDKEALTEHDVDVIRMLLTNRSEREKAVKHPYEMIFKGVANSNIQFKGGKMSLSKESATKKS